MQFLNPAAFYLLGVIPIVAALHFLKLRRHSYLVPSIMLWLPTAEDRKANVPFQRLRNLPLLLVQVLFLMLVTLSVARPALHRAGFLPGKAILIVDNSASMQSTEMGQPRLALAKQEALQRIEQISASDGMMVLVTHKIRSGDRPEPSYIQQAFTTDKEKLRRAVENIAATDVGGARLDFSIQQGAPIGIGGMRNEWHDYEPLHPVFDAAIRYADSPQDKVFFISDTFDNLPDVAHLQLHKVGVGGETENIGIVQFSLETEGEQYVVFVRIQNFTDTTREFNVRLAVAETGPRPYSSNKGGVDFPASGVSVLSAIDDKTVAIQAEQTKSVVFSGDARRLEGLVLSVHLEIEDDFPLDNTVSAILSTLPPLRILLVSDRQQPLLTHLLQTYGPHVELKPVSTDTYHGTGDADVTIFDNFAPEAVPEGHLIFITPRGKLPFMPGDAPPVETHTTPVRVIAADETHALMKGVSLMGLQVSKSTSRELPIWGHSLLETERGSLIWLGTEAGRQRLVFEFDAFNPEISDLALTIPGGPLFIYQCLAWLESGTASIKPLVFQEGRTPHVFRAGEPVSIGISTEEESPMRVQKPDNTSVTLHGSVFTETDRVGVYTVFAGDTPLERFTVNLLDATESALLAPAIAPMAEELKYEATSLQPVTQEIWRWFALMAFLLLLLEWWFYHRSSL